MKVICHIDDDLDNSDMILVGRAISHIREKAPEWASIGYEGLPVTIDIIKNKSSYSLWARKEQHES